MYLVSFVSIKCCCEYDKIKIMIQSIMITMFRWKQKSSVISNNSLVGILQINGNIRGNIYIASCDVL